MRDDLDIAEAAFLGLVVLMAGLAIRIAGEVMGFIR